MSEQLAFVPGLHSSHDNLDRFYTPDRLALSIVSRLSPYVHGRRVVEPSCGGGAFVRALHRAGALEVIGVDVDPEAAGLKSADLSLIADFGQAATLLEADDTIAAVVGNPPFGSDPDYLGLQHALTARRVAPVVALILPWSWLGLPSATCLLRGDLPDEVWPIYPRPWGDHLRESAVWVWLTPRVVTDRREVDGGTALRTTYARRRTLIDEPLVWR